MTDDRQRIDNSKPSKCLTSLLEVDPSPPSFNVGNGSGLAASPRHASNTELGGLGARAGNAMMVLCVLCLLCSMLMMRLYTARSRSQAKTDAPSSFNLRPRGCAKKALLTRFYSLKFESFLGWFSEPQNGYAKVVRLSVSHLMSKVLPGALPSIIAKGRAVQARTGSSWSGAAEPCDVRAQPP